MTVLCVVYIPFLAQSCQNTVGGHICKSLAASRAFSIEIYMTF